MRNYVNKLREIFNRNIYASRITETNSFSRRTSSLRAGANLFCTTIVLRCTPIFDRATINRFRLNSKRLPGRTSSVIETCNWFCMLRRYTKRWNGTHTPLPVTGLWLTYAMRWNSFKHRGLHSILIIRR